MWAGRCAARRWPDRDEAGGRRAVTVAAIGSGSLQEIRPTFQRLRRRLRRGRAVAWTTAVSADGQSSTGDDQAVRGNGGASWSPPACSGRRAGAGRRFSPALAAALGRWMPRLRPPGSWSGGPQRTSACNCASPARGREGQRAGSAARPAESAAVANPCLDSAARRRSAGGLPGPSSRRFLAGPGWRAGPGLARMQAHDIDGDPDDGRATAPRGRPADFGRWRPGRRRSWVAGEPFRGPPPRHRLGPMIPAPAFSCR